MLSTSRSDSDEHAGAEDEDVGGLGLPPPEADRVWYRSLDGRFVQVRARPPPLMRVHAATNRVFKSTLPASAHTGTRLSHMHLG